MPGLCAAGGVARGLDQIVAAMGHAAVAATDIHNRCALPTEDEPSGPGAPSDRRGAQPVWSDEAEATDPPW